LAAVHKVVCFVPVSWKVQPEGNRAMVVTLSMLLLHRTHEGELPGPHPPAGLRSSGPSMDLAAAGPSRRSLMIDLFSSGRKVGPCRQAWDCWGVGTAV
jgi:hypothetical protein